MNTKSFALIAAISVAGGVLNAQEMREVDSVLGTTNVPAAAERIYVDDPWTLGNVLALGARPVVSGVFGEANLDHLGNLDGIEIVPFGASAETIASYDPDLIIGRTGNGGWNEDRCAQFPNISSGYCYKYVYNSLEDLETNLLNIADALNLKDEAHELISQQNARIDTLRARVEATGLSNQLVSIIRVGDDQYTFRIAKEAIAFKELGINLPEDQMDPTETWEIPFSLENLDIAQADIIFVMVDQGVEEQLVALQENPLYATLPAVNNGQIFFVDTGIWIGGDFISENLVFDQIEELLIAPAE